MHLSENTLLDSAQGLLSPTEAEAVEAHLDACGECRALVAAWARADLGDDADAALPTRGASVGRYLILDALGAGSMGVVFSAFDPVLDRKVALKFLHLDRHQEGPEESRRRLLREAQALARVSHPNVVAVHDVGTWNEQVFLAMEFVDGQELGAFLATKRGEVGAILAVFREAGRGLSAVHAAGLVHRDFKASNVLVDGQGRVRVTDFGLARAERMQSPGATAPGLAVSTLTGTPAYMAPEQHRGGLIDARTDQFAFCVALYEAVYGVLPFGVLPMAQLAQAVSEGKVLDAPEGSEVPTWVRRILLRGLCVDPAGRFDSMDALVAALGDDPRRRRLRLLVAGAVGALALLTVGAVAFFSSPGQRYCQDLDAPMVSAWNPRVKTGLEQAFGRSFGAQAWRSTEVVLEGYAQEWVALRTEACRATRVRGEQSEAAMDLRVECLDKRRRAFTALVSALERAEPEARQQATEAALALEPLSTCNDGAALRLQPSAPPAAREALEQVEEGLSQSSALLETGQYVQGLARTVPLVSAAESIGYLPTLADVHSVRGRLLRHLDRFEEAETELRLAQRAAVASNSVARATEVVTELVGVVGDGLRRFKEGHELAALALAMIAARGDDEVAQAAVLELDANVYTRASEYPRALELSERALAIFEQPAAKAGPRLAAAVMHRANVLVRLARYPEAEAGYQRAKELLTSEYGPAHPAVARAWSNLCLVRHRQRRSADAVEACTQAIEIFEKISPDYPELGLTLTHLGAAQEQLHLLSAAAASYTRAIALLEKAHGPEHPLVATPLNNRANLFDELDRKPEAEADYLRSLAIREKALGPDHADVAETLFNLAELRRREGRPAEALGLYARALAIDEKRLGPTHPFLAGDLQGLAQSELEVGRAADALPLLERALVISEKGDDQEELGNIHASLALALVANHSDRNRARALGQQARKELAACGAKCAKTLKSLP